jgi:hypothetical protein
MLDSGRAGLAEFEVVIIEGKRDRKPAVVRDSVAHRDDPSPNPRAHLDLAQGRLLRWLCIGRAAGTTVRFALDEGRDRGFVLQLPEKVVGDGLEKLAFDGAIAPASPSQSLENPHRILR